MHSWYKVAHNCTKHKVVSKEGLWLNPDLTPGQSRGVTLPPDLIADLGVGWDRVAVGCQGVGETHEPLLLGDIARGLVRTVARDLVETDVLRQTRPRPWLQIDAGSMARDGDRCEVGHKARVRGVLE